MLDFIQPIKPWKDLDSGRTNEFFCLAELENLPWATKNLILEKKVDGIRIQLIKENDDIKMFSFHGNSIMSWPELESEAKKIKARTCILDGELYLPGGRAGDVFNIVKKDHSKLEELKLKFFDLLYKDGKSFLDKVLNERKKELDLAITDNKIFSKSLPFERPPDFMSWSVPGEGLVVKDLDSRYDEEGSKSWWKYVNPKYFSQSWIGKDISNLSDVNLQGAILCIHRLERKMFEGKAIDGFTDEDLISLHLDLGCEIEKRKIRLTDKVKNILDEPIDLEMKFLIKFGHIISRGQIQDRSDNSLLGLHARAKQIWEALIRRKGYHPYRIATVIDGMWWIKQEMIARGMRVFWSHPIDWWAYKYKGRLIESLKEKGIESTEKKSDEELKHVKLEIELEVDGKIISPEEDIRMLSEGYLPIFKGTTSERGAWINLNDFLSSLKNITLKTKFIGVKPDSKIFIDSSFGRPIKDIAEWRMMRGFPDLEKLSAEEFVQKWKPFKLRKPFIQLVGSLANWMRTDGDIDLIIHAAEDEPLYAFTCKAISESLPEWKDKLHLLSDQTWCGPFTNFVNLADLAVDDEGNLVILAEKSFFRMEMARDPSFEGKAKKSQSQDSIDVMKPFFQLKPTHGRTQTEQYSIEGLLRVIDKMWPSWKEDGIIVQRKYDGTTCQIHKKGNEVKIWTEDGSDITKNIPTLVNEIVTKHKDDWVAIGELELYLNGKHQPRSDSAAVINHLNKELEKDIRVTIYDKLWFNGKDIHKLPAIERLKHVADFQETEHFRKAEADFINNNEEALADAVKHFSGQEGSEGAMLKLAKAPYDLDKKSNEQIKYKKELFLIARVKEVNPIKGGNVFNYDMDLPGAEYLGRTYNTSIKAEKGEHLKVVFVDISEYHDGEKIWFNWWAPHVVEKTSEPLSSAKLAHEFVMKTTGRIEDKKLPMHGVEPKKPGQLEKQPEGYVKETEEIKKNKETPGAQKPHKFKPAKWTHPNGHPRCSVCGSEEMTDEGCEEYGVPIGWCPGLKKENKLECLETDFLQMKDLRMPPSRFLEYNGFKLLINCHEKKLLQLGPDAILINDPAAADGLKEGNDQPVYSTPEILDILKSFPMENIKPIETGQEMDLGSFHVKVDGKAEKPIFNITAGKDTVILEQLAKKYEWVFQNHWRGKSVHGDMRFEMPDGMLLGFTLANSFEGMVDEPVTTKSQALANKNIDEIWKMNFADGSVKERAGRTTLRVNTKARQPKAWLKMQGVTPSRSQEPGVPGGTQNYPGVFDIIDHGEMELGAQKPDFYEYFLLGNKWRGRVIFRFIPGLKGERELAGWLYWKPEDQTPYVLSSGAVKDGVLPPKGQTWLPTEWENKIPEELRFWETESRQDALDLRRELRRFLLKRNLLDTNEYLEQSTAFAEQEYQKSEQFLLTVLTWKGQTVVRDLPVNQYFIRIGNKPLFLFEKNPLMDPALNAVEDPEYSKYFKEGTYSPGSIINPNKKIDAKIENLDSGNVDVIEQKQGIIQLIFHGEKLKGRWLLRKDDPRESLWEMTKEGLLQRREYSDDKLNDLQVSKIKILTSFGRTRPRIAEILGVSKQTIWYHQCKLAGL